MFIRLIIRHLHYNIFKAKQQFLTILINFDFFSAIGRGRNLIHFFRQAAEKKFDKKEILMVAQGVDSPFQRISTA